MFTCRPHFSPNKKLFLDTRLRYQHKNLQSLTQITQMWNTCRLRDVWYIAKLRLIWVLHSNFALRTWNHFVQFHQYDVYSLVRIRERLTLLGVFYRIKQRESCQYVTDFNMIYKLLMQTVQLEGQNNTLALTATRISTKQYMLKSPQGSSRSQPQTQNLLQQQQ